MSYKKLIKNIIPLKLYLKYKFPLENKIILKQNIKTDSDNKSILFFTTQKTASSAINKLFNYLNSNFLKMYLTDFSGYVYTMSEEDESVSLNKNKDLIFNKKGVIYAPLRDYVFLDNIGNYKTIFFLRDPRDVLVSNYFSLAFSHNEPVNKKRLKNFRNIRLLTKEKSINEFARDQSDFFLNKYENYINHMAKYRDYTLLKYEDMIENHDEWINTLLEKLNIPITEKVKNDVRDIMQIGKTVDEDSDEHLRKKKPGDYKDKLNLETQDYLNNKFKNILEALEYEFN